MKRKPFNGQDNLGTCYHIGIDAMIYEEKAFQCDRQNDIVTNMEINEKSFQWYLKSAEKGNNCYYKELEQKKMKKKNF
ncbi:hypothetical protein Glove_520g13 [Diversispora epigaea]|uniref:Uncharacterized protein n=1 Tax=Diversispora epigaea TaxID=1348612 RepID=A0A397GEU9_9GLOM|nr:hypothetical protein Glove_520g13 [Diversispora epigaea]